MAPSGAMSSSCKIQGVRCKYEGRIQIPDCVAKVYGARRCYFSSYEKVPERGTLRTHQPDAARNNFDSFQYRGRESSIN